MIRFKRGQIVLVRFPFVEEGKTKLRPALILEDTLDNDVIICRITGKFHSSKFDLNITHWKESGLLIPSIIRVHKIATIEKSLIFRKLGNLESTILKDVNNQLKLLFN